MDFDQPVAMVGIDYISGFNGSNGKLEIYDADDNLLATYLTANLQSGDFERMMLSRGQADIAYAFASPNTVFGLLDNLQFGTQEPVALTDADGNYWFTELPIGDYVVREVVPDNFRQTTPISWPGRLFTTNVLTANPDLILELDPQTGATLNTFNAPVNANTGGHGLAFDGTTLYFVDFINDTVFEVDPDDGSVLDSFPLPTGSYDGVAALGSLVYIVDFNLDEILVVDPGSNAIVDTLDVNAASFGVDLSGGLGESGDGMRLVATTTLSGTFTDRGTADTHTVVVNWNDGSTSEAIVDQAAGTFTATHTYLDDDPNGTAMDDYTVAVTITDDDDGSDDDSIDVTVRNLAPAITSLSTTADTIGDHIPGDTVEISGTFTDMGTLDTHTATIFWGDGTSSDASITQGSGSGTFAGSHEYATGGFFEITVVLTDDDLGSDSHTVFAFVTGVRIEGGVLQIVGTGEADEVTINQQSNGTIKVHGEFLDVPGSHVTLPSGVIKHIGVFLGAGDDQFIVAGNIDIPIFVVGGAGDDQLKAGRGRSILLGGFGADHLIGGTGQDILIGGTTDFDLDPAALTALLREWASSRTLEERVANLFDGSGTLDRQNGDAFLTVGDGGTVHADDDQDKLTGGPDTDWFFFNPDDDKENDLRDEIFANDLDDLLGL